MLIVTQLVPPLTSSLSTMDVAPVVKRYRALIVKDKGLAEVLLWGAPDTAIRMRLHAVASKVEPELVLDPAYTSILQRDDLALIEMSDAVEALLVAREAVSRGRGERASVRRCGERKGGDESRRGGMRREVEAWTRVRQRESADHADARRVSSRRTAASGSPPAVAISHLHPRDRLRHQAEASAFKAPASEACTSTARLGRPGLPSLTTARQSRTSVRPSEAYPPFCHVVLGVYACSCAYARPSGGLGGWRSSLPMHDHADACGEKLENGWFGGGCCDAQSRWCMCRLEKWPGKPKSGGSADNVPPHLGRCGLREQTCQQGMGVDEAARALIEPLSSPS